jgi:hypothetical protein
LPIENVFNVGLLVFFKNEWCTSSNKVQSQIDVFQLWTQNDQFDEQVTFRLSLINHEFRQKISFPLFTILKTYAFTINSIMQLTLYKFRVNFPIL